MFSCESANEAYEKYRASKEIFDSAGMNVLTKSIDLMTIIKKKD